MVTAIAFSSYLASHSLQAVECLPNVSKIPKEVITQNKKIESGDISVSADNTDVIEDNRATFSGNVVIKQGDISMKAESASVDLVKGSMKAEGPLFFSDGDIEIQADAISADNTRKHAEIEQAQYIFVDKFARGDAELLELDETEGVTLHSGSFTTCPEGDESWRLNADEINISAEDGWGEAWHAKLSVYDTPVLYLPYVSFSLTDKRRSGLLYPQFRSSNNSGVEISQPFYWNIAPNYDATITPRYISKRGNQLISKVRYLEDDDSGRIIAEYLNDDDKLSSDSSRWLLSWNHQGRFDENWRYFVDYNDVSDDNYFVDLNSSLNFASSETDLYQFAELGYFTENWDLEFKYRDFRVLGDHRSPYRAAPYVNFNYHQEIFKNTKFGVLSELASFKNDDGQLDEANRFHIEPYLNWSWYSPFARAEVETAMMYTYFDQKTGADNVNELDSSASRALPKVRAYAGLQFERPTTWGNIDMTQTFEPQIQYLYVADRDQSKIGFYDSNILQDDFYGLFRDNRFSSYDRIANANQMTLGATTRIIDQKNKERVRFSIGQIIYFEDSFAETNLLEQEIKEGQSALASELFMQLGDRWGIRNSFQYDTQANSLLKVNTTVDWRLSDRKVVQVTHRYVPDLAGNEIRQVGALVSHPIGKEWQFVGSYHRDLEDDRSIEHYAGFQYQSCCWAFRVAMYREQNAQLDGLNVSDERDEYDSGIMLKFVFSGLGGERNASIDGMVDRGIFGYRQPFYLNN